MTAMIPRELLASCSSTCRLPGLPLGLFNLCVIGAIVVIGLMTGMKWYLDRRAFGKWTDAHRPGEPISVDARRLDRDDENAAPLAEGSESRWK